MSKNGINRRKTEKICEKPSRKRIKTAFIRVDPSTGSELALSLSKGRCLWFHLKKQSQLPALGRAADDEV